MYTKFFYWKFARIRKYNTLLIIFIFNNIFIVKKNSTNIKVVFIFSSFYLIRFISIRSLQIHQHKKNKLEEKKCDVENQKSFLYFAQTWIFYWLLRPWFFPRNNENSKLFFFSYLKENKFHYIYILCNTKSNNEQFNDNMWYYYNNFRCNILCYTYFMHIILYLYLIINDNLEIK